LGNGATESAEQMHVIFDPADANRMTVQFLGNAAKILVQSRTQDWVAQERASFFGGKDEMKICCGKSLGHGAGDCHNRSRGCNPLNLEEVRGHSPTLARQLLRWERGIVV